MTALAIALVGLAYLVGSIPTGLLLARGAGIDVRSAGSGNIGATNVARTAGRRLGLLTLAGDLVKGLAPVLATRFLLEEAAVLGAVAFAAVAGHVFPVFLGFRGGKGVATGLGALIGIAPLAAAIATAAFAVVFAISRIVSLASLGAVGFAPVVVWGLGSAPPIVVSVAGLGVLIVFRHRENVARLLSGTEPRFRARS